jgi:hypothetical protein
MAPKSTLWRGLNQSSTSLLLPSRLPIGSHYESLLEVPSSLTSANTVLRLCNTNPPSRPVSCLQMHSPTGSREAGSRNCVPLGVHNFAQSCPEFPKKVRFFPSAAFTKEQEGCVKKKWI